MYKAKEPPGNSPGRTKKRESRMTHTMVLINGRNSEPSFRQYTDLAASLERIYTETRGQLPYRKPPRRDPTGRERRTGKYCLFHELDGHTTDECRHLKDEVEEHARSGRLPQYVRERTTAVRPEQLPPQPNRNDPGSGSRLVIN